MANKGETLKERIRKGDIIVGGSVSLNATRQELEAIAASGQYDYLAIDSQHSPLNEEKLAAFSMLAHEVEMPVQFRIKHTYWSYLVGNFCDLGPASIEIPQVETEETVNEAIKYFYYPPFGNRSYGGAPRFGVQGRGEAAVYGPWWNDHGVLCMQLESVAAATNAMKFVKPGIDLLSWGPQDLTANIAVNSKHPSFKHMDDCIRYVADMLQGTQVRQSLRTTRENHDKYIKLGVTVFQERAQVVG